MTAGEGSLPSVIVVGDPRIHELLGRATAQWVLQPCQTNVDHMWESLSGGHIDTGSRVLVFTDAGSDGRPLQDSELHAVARAMSAMRTAGASVFLVRSSSATEQALAAHMAVLASQSDSDSSQNPLTLFPLGTSDDDILASIAEVVGAFVSIDDSLSDPSSETTAPAFPIPDIPVIRQVRDTASPGPAVAASPKIDISSHESKELLGRPRLPGQTTITVTSSKGGSGKSTASILLAASIASASRKAGKPLSVCLVDLDTRDGQVASMIGQFMPTALNIRVQPVWDEERIRRNLVRAEGLGIDTLLAPIRPRTAETVGPDFYRSIVRSLQRMYDVVVMDTSVQYLDPLIAEVALVEADEILFVTSLASTAVQGMARALREITAPIDESGLGIPREKLGIIVNQSVANVGMETDQVLAAGLGVPVVGVIPLATKDVLTATNLIQMHKLLEHAVLGVAYNELAIACMPTQELAPWEATADLHGQESRATSAEQAVSPDADVPTPKPETKKRGLLRR